MEEGAARCRSEDCQTRRERGVACRLGRRVRVRCICEMTLTCIFDSVGVGWVRVGSLGKARGERGGGKREGWLAGWGLPMPSLVSL